MRRTTDSARTGVNRRLLVTCVPSIPCALEQLVPLPARAVDEDPTTAATPAAAVGR
ncbi:MAG: hypothetical protein WD080_08845 [Egibacteraceae bacterium]